MEVVFGVLFLPCPLDLNGTKFSYRDGKEKGEEEGAWAGSWLLIYALEVQVQKCLQESFSSIFFLHTQ